MHGKMLSPNARFACSRVNLRVDSITKTATPADAIIDATGTRFIQTSVQSLAGAMSHHSNLASMTGSIPGDRMIAHPRRP